GLLPRRRDTGTRDSSVAPGRVAPAPRLAGRPSLGRREEVLERHVQERRPSLGEHLVAVPQRAVHVEPPSLAAGHLGAYEERPLDRDRPAKADEDARRHGRESVPRGEQPARLVEERRDDAAVDDAGTALVPLVEGAFGLVELDPLALGQRQPEPDRVVAAAVAGRVVLRRDTRPARHYLRPP